MIAKVPQEVPVEKAIKQEIRKSTAGMIPEFRVDLAVWATNGPVPRASHVSPIAKARIIRLARGISPPTPFMKISVISLIFIIFCIL